MTANIEPLALSWMKALKTRFNILHPVEKFTVAKHKPLERLNEELRRRERIIRIFPNVSSANRLIGALLIDQSEQWEYAARNYIKM